MRLYRPGMLFTRLYPQAISRLPIDRKELCLTFDDGPDCSSTSRLLEILSQRNIRAVFFCSGKKAEEHPGLMEDIKAAGHLTGNHGYEHLDGFRTSLIKYRKNADDAALFTSDKLFRPPYGRLTPSQYHNLKDAYRIILWDIMPYDFSDITRGVKPLGILKSMIRPGSVIVLHDSIQSAARKFLDEFIIYSAGEGYTFVLPELN
jgi:peptidoglycan/xylan/chitin deacetylase (PgdA/CDA1 family)